ncbi:MAG: exopolysaccharide biosynthesis polyprenyl glycosylphosphotransferase [Deltaproteobacteria bacterium]|nr:exopolysaccharide biosynthesis polyprenyl glycosylphosphotransferase [Deltaproteobacteria bacterium]
MRPRAVTLALIEIGVLVLLLCGAVVLWARPSSLDWWHVAEQAAMALIPVLCLMVSFYYNDLYDLRTVRNFAEFSARLPRALGVSFVLAAAAYTLFPGLEVNGGPFPSGPGRLLVVVALVLPLRGALYAGLKASAFAERVLILGTSALAWKIAAEIEAASSRSYIIAGFVADGEVPLRSFSSSVYPVFGSLERLELIISEVRPDRIIVALAERRGRLPVRTLLTARMAGILVEDGIEVHERFTGKLAIESLTPSFLIFSKDFKKSRLQTALRRVVSLATAAVGLILTLPLMVLIAAAIKLDSAGPVFFVQERAGVGGWSFGLMKFRTMHPAADETSAWVQDNTARITRVGKWLRQFRLDELPQFLNILRGDMNLVGPRPHPVSNFKLFMTNIPYYSLRSLVRPGMTGWAQVCYPYANNLEEETEKMRYDLFYIKNLSLWLDLRILIDTVKIILFGQGKQARSETTAERTPEAVTGARDGSTGPQTPEAITKAVDPVTLSDAQGLKRQPETLRHSA